jgi:hypothetical protein
VEAKSSIEKCEDDGVAIGWESALGTSPEEEEELEVRRLGAVLPHMRAVPTESSSGWSVMSTTSTVAIDCPF